MAPVSMKALDKAILLAGTPTELAKRLNVKPQNIFNWRKRGVPAERVPDVVDAVDGKVFAHELRPDLPRLFPVPTDDAIAA